MDYYKDHCFDYTAPYPGIKELVEDLHKEGIKLACVTNKPHTVAEVIVPKLFGIALLLHMEDVQIILKSLISLL